MRIYFSDPTSTTSTAVTVPVVRAGAHRAERPPLDPSD